MTTKNTATTSSDQPSDDAPSVQQPPTLIWPPVELEDAVEQLLEQTGYYDPDSDRYGRLDIALMRRLSQLLRRHVPRTPAELISVIPPVQGKPYESTGLNSLQPQIDLMNAVFGEAHWRLRMTPIPEEVGSYLVDLLIGNDLDPITQLDGDELVAGQDGTTPEVFVHHQLVGSNPGPNSANRMKGALTNAGKRLLAMVGACGDVYRFVHDLDPAHQGPDRASGADPAGRQPAASSRQIGFARDLIVADVAGDPVRASGQIARLAELAGTEVPEFDTPEAFEAAVRRLLGTMGRAQVSQIIEGLQARAARTPSAGQASQVAQQAIAAATRPNGNGAAPAPAAVPVDLSWTDVPPAGDGAPPADGSDQPQ